jgi:hypothetical protein
MNTLYELLKNTYLNIDGLCLGLNKVSYDILKNVPFDDFIDDENLCIDFIRSVLIDDSTNIVLNKGRSKHIIITWLLGVSIQKSFNLKLDDGDIGSLFNNQIWLQTAITHDYGYFRKELMDENLTIQNLTNSYSLLTDDYSIYDEEFHRLNNFSKLHSAKAYFTYTYQEIVNYFNYRKEQLNKTKDEHEKNDHGIIGGCIAFKKYCKGVERDLKHALKPSIAIMLQQKIACFTTASHNVYKSDSFETDEVYKRYELNDLLFNSAKRVTLSNKLLLLLSLVDTIECSKRFISTGESRSYIQQSTILKYVRLDLFNNQAILDFSDFRKFIKEKRKDNEMIIKLDKHINSILDINSWTDFRSIPLSIDKIEITL